MQKAWLMALMKYSPSEKGIMTPMILWKIGFMEYQSKLVLCVTWSGQAKVMLPVVFEVFEMLLFSFHSHYQLVKGQL